MIMRRSDKRKSGAAEKIALWGILSALAVAVSAAESALDLPFLPPGAKPGLSNVVTVTAAVLSGFAGAFYITAVKALFALITRGVTAFILSFCGGMLSAAVTVLLLKRCGKYFSVIGISAAGAFVHNTAQLAAAMVITSTPALIYYAPLLWIFALISGILTGMIIKAVRPYTDRLSGGKDSIPPVSDSNKKPDQGEEI